MYLPKFVFFFFLLLLGLYYIHLDVSQTMRYIWQAEITNSGPLNSAGLNVWIFFNSRYFGTTQALAGCICGCGQTRILRTDSVN